MNVFFYGLFMDDVLLEKKGVEASDISVGFVDGYRLHIGERATLVPKAGHQCHGLLMHVDRDSVLELYSEQSVADYGPEPVTVELADGSRHDAICYNLPSDKISGTNRAYAASLLELASRLELPDRYLREIRYFIDT